MKIKSQKQNILELAVFVILIAGTIGCAGFYLCQVNSRAASTFKLSELDKKVSKLEQEVEDLKIKSANMQSISILEEKSKEMGMARISSAEFVDINKAVALR